MNCAEPPVYGGNPIPMIEPMLASAVDVSTPSSRHFWVSSASANNIRSIMSCSGMLALPDLHVSRSLGRVRRVGATLVLDTLARCHGDLVHQLEVELVGQLQRRGRVAGLATCLLDAGGAEAPSAPGGGLGGKGCGGA